MLDSAGGIWQFKADKLNQTYKDGTRYATGIRNVVGLDWNDASMNFMPCSMDVMDCSRCFPKLYNAEQGAELPAEELLQVKKGRRLWLALLLLRSWSEQKDPGAGIWRRRQTTGKLRRRRHTCVCIPGSLGSECSAFLYRRPVP